MSAVKNQERTSIYFSIGNKNTVNMCLLNNVQILSSIKFFYRETFDLFQKRKKYKSKKGESL